MCCCCSQICVWYRCFFGFIDSVGASNLWDECDEKPGRYLIRMSQSEKSLVVEFFRNNEVIFVKGLKYEEDCLVLKQQNKTKESYTDFSEFCQAKKSILQNAVDGTRFNVGTYIYIYIYIYITLLIAYCVVRCCCVVLLLLCCLCCCVVVLPFLEFLLYF